MKLQSPRLEDYLIDDSVIDWTHSDVQARARTLVSGLDNVELLTKFDRRTDVMRNLPGQLN